MLQPPTEGTDGPGSWPLNVSLSGGPIALVFGVVTGAGRVILGEYGWRAERARVDALYVPPSRSPADHLLMAAETYGVPIYRDIGAMCRDRGPDAWIMDMAGLSA